MRPYLTRAHMPTRTNRTPHGCTRTRARAHTHTHTHTRRHRHRHGHSHTKTHRHKHRHTVKTHTHPRARKGTRTAPRWNHARRRAAIKSPVPVKLSGSFGTQIFTLSLSTRWPSPFPFSLPERGAPGSPEAAPADAPPPSSAEPPPPCCGERECTREAMSVMVSGSSGNDRLVITTHGIPSSWSASTA